MPARIFRRLFPIVLLALLAPRTGSAQSDPTPVQLTFSGNVADGAVSPDGRYLAYVESSVTGDDRLLIRPIAGGEPTELARALHVFHLRWSPSGESLLVGVESADTMGIRILPRHGGPGRTFDIARWFAWSPDETEFAYGYYNPHALFVRDLATERVDTLALPGDYDILLDVDWSRAGDRLAYVVHREPSTYEVRVIGRSGDRPRIVLTDSFPLYSPRWSRDGQAILFSRSPNRISMDVVRVEAEPDGGARGAAKPIAHLGWGISFDLVEEDSAISYIGTRGESDLVLLDLETGERRSLASASTVGDPAVSPDGREVAFLHMRERTTSLDVLTLDSGARRTLTSTEGGICCLAWSPDGREIAYASSTGPVRFWRVPSEGGTPSLLSDDSTRRATALQWESRDRLLVHAITHYGSVQSLYWIDPESGHERSLEVAEIPMLFGVRVSPDGSTLVGGTGRELVLLSLGDGTSRQIPADGQLPIGWSPAGDDIYTYDVEALRVHRHSLSEGGTEIVAEVECTGGAIVPDGSALVCATPGAGDGGSDLWIARGVPHDSAPAER